MIFPLYLPVSGTSLIFKESSPSSSAYQKAALWSIYMPWESKLFSLIALVICPETVWKWEPALKAVWYESLVTFTREQKIQFFNLLWVSWAAGPLDAVSTVENKRPDVSPPLKAALRRTVVKKRFTKCEPFESLQLISGFRTDCMSGAALNWCIHQKNMHQQK